MIRTTASLSHVKNDVVIRISPSYGYGDAEDMDGNRSSHRWEPRICNKGMVMNRKPILTEGQKARWLELASRHGQMRDIHGREQTASRIKNSATRKRAFIKLPWTEAYALAAGALENIS
ncbi:MAG: hypothetical protein IPP36_03440 [Nitrosomonadales bacterium]|nr:hypothetical protein [Nitrosomonadales bacterium]